MTRRYNRARLRYWLLVNLCDTPERRFLRGQANKIMRTRYYFARESEERLKRTATRVAERLKREGGGR